MVVLPVRGLDGELAAHHAGSSIQAPTELNTGQSLPLCLRARAPRREPAAVSPPIDCEKVEERASQSRSCAACGRLAARFKGHLPARHHHGRDVERHLQRGAVPVDRRPAHADHADATGPLSLCRNSLVFHHIQPRRPDHRAADAVVRPERGAGSAREEHRRLSGDRDPRCRTPTRSREKICARCAAARWRHCARYRSGSTMAA